MNFIDYIIEKGWSEVQENWTYSKGDWEIAFDTGSWMMIGNKHNPRVWDVPYPDEIHVRWTLGLIEHLCKMEDERCRLRKALEAIDTDPGLSDQNKILAQQALDNCYHTWLINPHAEENSDSRLYCPICNQKKSDSISSET